MTFKVLMATHNRGKVAELKSLLPGLPIQVFTLADFPALSVMEETGITFLENAVQKAKIAAEFSGYPSLADDSGLVVDVLGGQPGVHSARFAGEPGNDQANNLKLLRLLKGIPFSQRTARFISVIAFVTPQGQVYTAEGRCEGIILDKLQGTGGFGYDPLFYLSELGKTMAELTLAEKNKISHRGKAWREIVPFLQTIFQE
ncbi:MAG TPA: XTP/dITP diphosphatase [Clostridia bacterium]|jgi:XTP/dITP diphosphohydrolase|nr:XTP/dITP diphosphatase [Clostridia bacterium]HHY06540.1 XTP/dITP diphosphatase [Clostridia bacterium]